VRNERPLRQLFQERHDAARRAWDELRPVHDIAQADRQLAGLLAQTAGQILTTLPGVAVIRAGADAKARRPLRGLSGAGAVGGDGPWPLVARAAPHPPGSQQAPP
jgi:hypothetical protein